MNIEKEEGLSMKKLYMLFMGTSKRIRDSIKFSFATVGFISTLFTILGVSLDRCGNFSIMHRLVIVIVIAIFVFFIAYFVIGIIYREAVNLLIKQMPVTIVCGDIFDTEGMKVIGCDNHFDTRIDDKVIAKKSLHGQLVLNHGNAEEIKKIVEEEAIRLNIKKDRNGQYNFPLGTIIRYDSSVDKQTYLLLALTKLDKEFKAHTNMAEYEQTLMKMWKELDRIYAMNDIALPLLGAGIPRFDSGPVGRNALLRCMLCTLNGSGVNFKANLKIVIYGNNEDIPLYEYKDMFYEVLRR